MPAMAGRPMSAMAPPSIAAPFLPWGRRHIIGAVSGPVSFHLISTPTKERKPLTLHPVFIDSATRTAAHSLLGGAGTHGGRRNARRRGPGGRLRPADGAASGRRLRPRFRRPAL